MAAIERFLIVDETEANTLLFQVLLKGIGIDNPIIAHNGPGALEIVEREKIQFVIAAWDMKVMPGYAFLQRARASRKNNHLPCLLYFKNMSDKERKLIDELEIDNVFSLPFDKAKLSATIKEMMDAEDMGKNPIEAKLRRVELLVRERKPSEALPLCVQCTTKGKHQPRAYTLLGDCYVLINSNDRAERAFQMALSIRPTHAAAAHRLARLYSRIGKHDQAINLLQKMTSESPLNIGTLTTLGASLSDANRNEEAKAVVEQASEIDPDNQLVRDEKGKQAFKEGDFSLAAQLLAATENTEEMARHFNNMGIALVAQNKYDESVKTYKAAIEMLPDKSRVYLLEYNLGLAQLKKGDVGSAFGQLARAYLARPDFEKAYAGAVKAYQQIKAKGDPVDPELVRALNAAWSGHKASAQAAATAKKAS